MAQNKNTMSMSAITRKQSGNFKVGGKVGKAKPTMKRGGMKKGC